MIKLLLFLAFLIGTLHAYPTFNQYVHDFNKTYPTQQQRTFRQGIYSSRLAYFQTVTQFTPGVNNFTDWTTQQLKSLKSVIYQQPNSNQNHQEVSSNLRVDAASSLDWRYTAVTRIKNQGACGSCWAFSTTAYVQSALIINRGYSKSIDLSQQYILSCTSGSSCAGGYPTDAFTLASAGIPTQRSYPYYQAVLNNGICMTHNKVVLPSSSIGTYYYISESALINLLQQGPVAISISADNWQYYGGGTFSCSPSATINHGVLLVGYTSSYWIIKNQWGPSFGIGGYIYITRSGYGTYQNCLIGRQANTFNIINWEQQIKSLILVALALIAIALF